jgi:Fe-S-cluster containining protein
MKNKESENKKFLEKLKRTRPRDLDDVVHTIHTDIFQKTDCLTCANCCKSISPMITDKDIERIAKHLKMRPSLFTEKYLHLDQENDYVFNSAPCPFLMKDNYCSIYDVRPKACREYPHTDSKNFYKLLYLTLKNTLVCPAVFEIVEELKKKY